MSIALAYQQNLHQADELEALIEGCSRNERGAQNKLYEMFYPRMKAMVVRYFHEEEKAEEIMNFGFLKAFQNIKKFSFKGSFEGWLRSIMRNCIADYANKQKVYKETIKFYDKKEGTDEYVSKSTISQLYYEDLLKLVRCLPEMERVVFNMYAIEGLTHREIGDLLCIKEGTSKWYVSEARRKLKIKIEALGLQFKK